MIPLPAGAQPKADTLDGRARPVVGPGFASASAPAGLWKEPVRPFLDELAAMSTRPDEPPGNVQSLLSAVKKTGVAPEWILDTPLPEDVLAEAWREAGLDPEPLGRQGIAQMLEHSRSVLAAIRQTDLGPAVIPDAMLPEGALLAAWRDAGLDPDSLDIESLSAMMEAAREWDMWEEQSVAPSPTPGKREALLDADRSFIRADPVAIAGPQEQPQDVPVPLRTNSRVETSAADAMFEESADPDKDEPGATHDNQGSGPAENAIWPPSVEAMQFQPVAAGTSDSSDSSAGPSDNSPGAGARRASLHADVRAAEVAMSSLQNLPQAGPAKDPEEAGRGETSIRSDPAAGGSAAITTPGRHGVPGPGFATVGKGDHTLAAVALEKGAPSTPSAAQAPWSTVNNVTPARSAALADSAPSEIPEVRTHSGMNLSGGSNGKGAGQAHQTPIPAGAHAADVPGPGNPFDVKHHTVSGDAAAVDTLGAHDRLADKTVTMPRATANDAAGGRALPQSTMENAGFVVPSRTTWTPGARREHESAGMDTLHAPKDPSDVARLAPAAWRGIGETGNPAAPESHMATQIPAAPPSTRWSGPLSRNGDPIQTPAPFRDSGPASQGDSLRQPNSAIPFLSSDEPSDRHLPGIRRLEQAVNAGSYGSAMADTEAVARPSHIPQSPPPDRILGHQRDPSVTGDGAPWTLNRVGSGNPSSLVAAEEGNAASPAQASQATAAASPLPNVAASALPEVSLRFRAGTEDADMLDGIANATESASATRASTAHVPSMARGDSAVHVSRQITAAIHGSGESSFDVSLSPSELGKVRIGITPADGGISVSVFADRPETLDLLRRHANILAQEFRDIGYGAISFSFASGDQREHRSERAAHEARADSVAIDQGRESRSSSIPAGQTPEGFRRDVSGRMDIRI